MTNLPRSKIIYRHVPYYQSPKKQNCFQSIHTAEARQYHVALPSLIDSSLSLSCLSNNIISESDHSFAKQVSCQINALPALPFILEICSPNLPRWRSNRDKKRTNCERQLLTIHIYRDLRNQIKLCTRSYYKPFKPRNDICRPV